MLLKLFDGHLVMNIWVVFFSEWFGVWSGRIVIGEDANKDQTCDA